MRFRTESGSTYEIRDGLDEDQKTVTVVRRLNPEYTKRADGEWKILLNDPHVEKGFRAVLVMESLSGYGADDHGQEGGGPTVRTTSIVTEVWEDEILQWRNRLIGAVTNGLVVSLG